MKSTLQLFAILLAISFLSSCDDGKSISEIKLIPVKSGKDFQYIDQEGKIVINPQFSEATVFRNGLALIKNSGENPMWGFISEDGKVSIMANFKQATIFSEDLAWVVSENGAPTAIDIKGQVKITMQNAEFVRIFKDGLAAFSQIDSSGQKWGFIDKEGKVKINLQFLAVGNFSNGKCAVQNPEGKWGYIDKEGKILINYQFEGAKEFVNGKAVVVSGGKAGLIDEGGKYLINPQFSDMIIDNDMFLINQDGKWGWCDQDGKITINPQFNEAFPFVGNDLAAVQSGEKFGYIDKDGKIVINPQFDYAFPFNGKLALVSSANKYGFIDTDGKFAINPQFDDASSDMKAYMRNGSSVYENVNTEFFNIGAIVSRINVNKPEGLSIGDPLSKALTKFNKTENDINLYAGEFKMKDNEKITNDASLFLFVKCIPYSEVAAGWNIKRVYDANAKLTGFTYCINLFGKGIGKEKEIIEAIGKSLSGFKKDEVNSSEFSYIYTNEKLNVQIAKGTYYSIVVIINDELSKLNTELDNALNEYGD